MSTIEAKINTEYYLAFPFVDAGNPDKFLTGATPALTAYSKDGVATWQTLSVADTATEIGTTGVYELTLSAAEMNHDKVLVKLSAAGAADTAFVWELRKELAEDLGNGAGQVTLTDASVDSIWDEPQAGHTTPLTFGANLNEQVSTRATVNAIWDQPRTSHLMLGSMGWLQGNLAFIEGTAIPQPTPPSLLATNFGTLFGNADAAATLTLDAVALQATLSGVDTKVDAIISTGGTGPWTTASVAGLALEATSQTILTTGGPGPWTTGTAASAVSRMVCQSPANVEIPPSGTRQFDVLIFAQDADGQPVNTDAPPVLTAEDFQGNSLDANWDGPITNPVTGRYERTYNLADSANPGEIIFLASAAIATEPRTDGSITTAFVDTPDLTAQQVWEYTGGGGRSLTTAANITSDGAAINTTAGKVDSVALVDVTTDVTNGVTVSDKTGFILDATGLDQVLVASKTVPNALRIISSTVAGQFSGAGSGTERATDFAGTEVVVATIVGGNRPAVVYPNT